MKRKQHRSRAGFTLVEVALVLVIVAILAAIAAPSVFSFIESGQQTNRMTIARTIYLGAQDKLTQLRLNGGLKEALSAPNPYDGPYYPPGYPKANGRYVLENTALRAVYKPEGKIEPSAEEALKADYVHYISKPSGATSWAVEEAGKTLMWYLLSQIVLDQTVLDGAILIEYNIETGIILSVFYGDKPEQKTGFVYTDDDFSGILGGRGMDVYSPVAEARHQGYYGVGNTGTIEMKNELYVYLRDTATDEKLPDENENTLYADIYISAGEWTKELFELTVNGETIAEFKPEDYLAYSAPADSLYLYKHPVSGGSDMLRFVCILDQVLGDTVNDPYIGHLRGKGLSCDITATLTGPGEMISESNEKHPYYLSQESGGTFIISSARHLFNIRETSDGNFRLANDIDLAQAYSAVTNFAPITAFGSATVKNVLDGSYKTISNLKIDVGLNAGLFGNFYNGEVKDLTFVLPEINGGANAGALCGILFDEAEAKNITVKNPKVTATDPSLSANAGGLSGSLIGKAVNVTVESPTVLGGTNAGGVCGVLDGGSIDKAYVQYKNADSNDKEIRKGAGEATGINPAGAGGIAGGAHNVGKIENAVFVSPHDTSRIAATPTTGHKGGVIGDSWSATLHNIQFLALAPGDDVCMYPIVGNGGLSLSDNYYYLSGQSVWPVIGPIVDEKGGLYNSSELAYDNIGTPLRTWEMREEADLSGTWVFLSDAAYPDPDEETILALDAGMPKYKTYPYRTYYSDTAGIISAEYPDWPLVGEVEDDEVVVTAAYFEQYTNSAGPWGFWAFGDSDGTLRANLPVVRAGYALIVESSKKPEIVKANGMAAESILDGADYGFPDKWVCILPLDKLVEELDPADPGCPVALSFDVDGKVGDVEGYVQPLFAKGVYETFDVGKEDNPFYVRTPWQMRSIGNYFTLPPVTPPGGGIDGLTYFDTGTIGIGSVGGTPQYRGIPIAVDIPDINVNQRIDNIRDNALKGDKPLLIKDQSIIVGGSNLIVDSPNAWTTNISVTGGTDVSTNWAQQFRIHGHGNGTVTVTSLDQSFSYGPVETDCLVIYSYIRTVLTGDFTGINISNYTNNPFSLGSGSDAFTMHNDKDDHGYIYAGGTVNVNVSSGTIMENVSVGAGNEVLFASNPTAEYVSMNAIFYSRTTMIQNGFPGAQLGISGGLIGGISSSDWNTAMIPQFITTNSGVGLTIQGSPRMGGVFYTGSNGTQVHLPGVEHFDGLFYANNNSVPLMTGGVGDVLPDVPIIPILLPTGLDPAIQAYLQSKGWQMIDADDPDSLINTDLFFHQDRNINFISDSQGLFGGEGYDGTTTNLSGANAVVQDIFGSTYDGCNFSVSNVTIETTEHSAGLFSQNAGTIRNVKLIDAVVRGALLGGANRANINNVGGIAGTNYMPGKIEYCSVLDSIIAGNFRVGGVTGQNRGRLHFSTMTGTSVAGNYFVGGIVGENRNPANTIMAGLPFNAMIFGLPILWFGRRRSWVRRCVPRARKR